MNVLAVVDGVGAWTADQEEDDEREGVWLTPVEVRQGSRGKINVIEGERVRALIDDRFPRPFWEARKGACVLLSGRTQYDQADGFVIHLDAVTDMSMHADTTIKWKG